MRRKQGNEESIVQAITEQIRNGKLHPGDKIQTEENLAREYGVNVYTARKALNRLKQGGILYSVPKFGIFVGNDWEKLDADSKAVFMFQPDSTIPLATGSVLPDQKKMWNGICEYLEKTVSTSRLRIEYTGDLSPENGNAEIYENSAIIFAASQKDTVNFREFFPGILRHAPYPEQPCSIPFYYIGALLIWNAELLEQLGIPLPAYRNYSEQTAYLRRALKISAENGMRNPGITQSYTVILPPSLQRAVFDELISDHPSEKGFIRRFRKPFLEAISLFRDYPTDYPHTPEAALVDFSLGKSPFFFGETKDFIALRSSDLPFPVGGAMMFACDGLWTRLPMCLSLREDSPKMLHAVRLLRRIQDDAVQKLIAQTGALPLDESNRKKLPLHIILPEKEAASPLVYRSFEEQYILNRCISVELWNITLNGKTPEEAMQDMYLYARSWLGIRLKRMTPDERGAWFARHGNPGRNDGFLKL